MNGKSEEEESGEDIFEGSQSTQVIYDSFASAVRLTALSDHKYLLIQIQEDKFSKSEQTFHTCRTSIVSAASVPQSVSVPNPSSNSDPALESTDTSFGHPPTYPLSAKKVVKGHRNVSGQTVRHTARSTAHSTLR